MQPLSSMGSLIKRVAVSELTLKEKLHRYTTPEPNSGRWLWTGGLWHNGYGRLWDGVRSKKAHRVSYELYKGHIPLNMMVMHTCDVKSCVNPEHLCAGTAKANSDDCINKGRRKNHFGESNGAHKLTESEVKEIKSGVISLSKASRRYAVSKTTISLILRGLRRLNG